MDSIGLFKQNPLSALLTTVAADVLMNQQLAAMSDIERAFDYR